MKRKEEAMPAKPSCKRAVAFKISFNADQVLAPICYYVHETKKRVYKQDDE